MSAGPSGLDGRDAAHGMGLTSRTVTRASHAVTSITSEVGSGRCAVAVDAIAMEPVRISLPLVRTRLAVLLGVQEVAVRPVSFFFASCIG